MEKCPECQYYIKCTEFPEELEDTDFNEFCPFYDLVTDEHGNITTFKLKR